MTTQSTDTTYSFSYNEASHAVNQLTIHPTGKPVGMSTLPFLFWKRINTI